MIELLKEHLVRKPFVPFRIVLSDGRQLEVVRLGQVGVGLTKFTYVTPDRKNSVKSDESHIVSIEPLGSARATA